MREEKGSVKREWKVESGKCGVWNVKCGVSSVKCKVWSVKCGV